MKRWLLLVILVLVGCRAAEGERGYLAETEWEADKAQVVALAAELTEWDGLNLSTLSMEPGHVMPGTENMRKWRAVRNAERVVWVDCIFARFGEFGWASVVNVRVDMIHQWSLYVVESDVC